MKNRRLGRVVVGLVAVAALATGCAQAVAGRAIRAVEGGGTVSQGPQPEIESGLKADAPTPNIEVVDAQPNNKYDLLAESTIEDLYTYYGEVMPSQFNQEFTPAKELQSYDSSTSRGSACGAPLDRVNASYIPRCDMIIWDRGQLMPMMEQEVGMLSSPTILAHEMGHLIQSRLHAEQTSVLLLEQQADCYAGAYWRWVADGHSKFFQIAPNGGMRQILLAMMWVGDPIGLPSDTSSAHGSSFDRTFAASLGYANGAKRCSEISQQEVDARIQQTGFTQVPQNYGNVEISEELIKDVADTLNSYFQQTVQSSYKPPTLQPYTGETPPACQGTTPEAPVDYCPTNNTINYNLAQLQKIGTPTADWSSTNGDFSAIILLASRYGLAAQSSGGGALEGDQAGLRGLCYAGTWANWMKKPQGAKKLMLSANDLNKAAYQVIESPFAAGDVNSKTSTTVLDQMQAFHIGVIYDIRKCFDYYPT